MQIQLDTAQGNVIIRYDNNSVTVNEKTLNTNCMITHDTLITPWKINAIAELSPSTIDPIRKLNPEVILIGHNQINTPTPIELLAYLSKIRIGIEFMSIGSASRTFNILSAEKRRVCAGFIF